MLHVSTPFRPLRSLRLICGLLLALFAFGAAQPAMALPCIVGISVETGGVTICIGILGTGGGGSVATDNGPTQFTLFATRNTAREGTGDGSVIGQVQWSATGANGEALLLQSIDVSDYGPVAGTEGARFIHGTMSVNGAGEYPFELVAVDAGPPGEAQDTVSLKVGNQLDGEAASDFGYAAEGPLETGDIQLLNFADTAEQ